MPHAQTRPVSQVLEEQRSQNHKLALQCIEVGWSCRRNAGVSPFMGTFDSLMLRHDYQLEPWPTWRLQQIGGALLTARLSLLSCAEGLEIECCCRKSPGTCCR